MTRSVLADLDAVLSIARLGSFRAAALDLGISTTALSNAIAKLEQRLGIRLFNRTTRSVSLTDAGKTFVERVGPAVTDIHDAMLAAQSLQEVPTGTLRINAFATAAREVMEPLILSFIQRYPQVHIDLVTEGRIVDIVAAGFDLGLRPADLVPADMIAVPLGLTRSNAVVASPEFLQTHGRPAVPADLYRFRCIRARLPNNALFRWKFERDGKAVQIDVQGSITLDESSLVRIAAQNGVGLGYVMEADVREDIAAGRLIRVLEDWTPALAPLALYYPGRKNPPAAFTSFIQAAREFAKGC
ncbi:MULTISPECIES: LysR family transcriptional regulator [Agrobacterium]|jgi:DNA-binding transcriptional LysR family regulator|uniref:DNA-binding transcriptional LysR family regulator n=1 Tax=Agrobacterium radiobacter TaxID=362 RepID=A0ABR6JDZ6_AGRRD|nr:MULTISPECIES: LysR family transcriptional regulator [Agrobacterium tumefaciens complex]KAB0459088.1 LysR family transcriptional regulator [Agrobacterium tumefaciens]KWT79330.1 LysR family transcriptional regulator [Agrobacterium radiobacter]MBB4321209.1 DNA-binding transcriptional LysR family regulator [Agrobacterium radiobacter]MBB4338249.1 DNA-binding transcriptional LysR family regulator [Agrobacterium radiobacter]MBB4493137.1 DNA-binding transcriptional LysR family regulator [Agrobacter